MSWSAFFGRRRGREAELVEEIRSHLEMAVNDRLARGESRDEAERYARREFGNELLVREVTRDMWGRGWLERVGLDFRYALRAVRRNPGFAAIAIVTLALGIGANSAIFSVVNAVLLRRLPYREADRLVMVTSSVAFGSRRDPSRALSYPDFQDVSGLTDAVAGTAAYSNDRVNLTSAAEPREVQVTRATSDLLAVLGVSPALGRAFGTGEDHAPLAIISHALWLSDFGADRNVLGRTLSLDDRSFTIIGVMPAGFDFPDASTDAWIPIWWAMADAPEASVQRGYRAFSTVARLAPGATLARLRSDLDVLGKRLTALEQQEPGDGEGRRAHSKAPTSERFDATLLRDQVGGDARQPLLVLFGAVALVLLIACVNAASLLMARAQTREQEFAVRRALGAGRWPIVRQLLVESVLLATVAALVGFLLAAGGLRLLAAQVPRGYVVGVDGTVLGFTLALAVATGLAFGVVPALRASAPALEQSLRAGAGGTAGPAHRRARNALVVSEVALALVLLVGSVLLVRSFIDLNSIDPGFDPRGLLAARIRLTPARYPTVSQQRTFFDDITGRLRGRPGVSAVTVASSPPLSGMRPTVGMNPRDIRPDDPDQFLALEVTAVGPDFFSTMGIPILQGRPITAQDREGAPPVCVVNRALARRLWPHRSPIGQGGMGPRGDAIVVGVVGDVHGDVLEREGGPAIYLPAAQSNRGTDEMWVVMRAPHPLRLAPVLQQIVHAEDPAQPIARITTYDQVIQRRYAGLRLVAALMTLFAALALVLASIGMAGVTAYTVSRRTREFGIRIALGARARDVLRLVLRETLVTVGIGVAVGLAVAVAAARTLGSLLFGVTASDPGTFLGAALSLGLVALCASYLPARRAARVDPLVALRSE